MSNEDIKYMKFHLVELQDRVSNYVSICKNTRRKTILALLAQVDAELRILAVEETGKAQIEPINTGEALQGTVSELEVKTSFEDQVVLESGATIDLVEEDPTFVEQVGTDGSVEQGDKSDE